MEENIALILDKIVDKINVYNTNNIFKGTICIPFTSYFLDL